MWSLMDFFYVKMSIQESSSVTKIESYAKQDLKGTSPSKNSQNHRVLRNKMPKLETALLITNT